jgi:NTP pyrophosphatase (non-canonical NTP hydrolase)
MFQQMSLDIGATYARTMAHYGPLVQLSTSIEELGEVEGAFSKVIRHGASVETVGKLMEEIGDAVNMVEQVLHMYGALDDVKNLMDVGATEYPNEAALMARLVKSSSKLRVELAEAMDSYAQGLAEGNRGVDASPIAVYAGETFRKFSDVAQWYGYPLEKLRETREAKLARCLARMAGEVAGA